MNSVMFILSKKTFVSINALQRSPICAFWLSRVVWNLCTFQGAQRDFRKITSLSTDYYKRNTTVSDQIQQQLNSNMCNI